MSKRLVVIDGKSVFYRGYYAMPNLSTKDGTPTGGVYGFATMALEIVRQLKPDYVCVAWDKSKTNIRSRLALYPQYKANRKPAPPDFYVQIPILHDLLDSLGWPLYEIDDYEADDIMGAFAKQATAKNIETYLISSDLDILQLIGPQTHIYTIKKGLTNIEMFKEDYFREKYGIEPNQFVDLKSLKGDSSDNIPGVAGVGEKTALELIKQFGTLDGVYENLDNIKPSLREKLEKSRAMAYLSKKLVTLMVDAPIQLDFDKAKLDDGFTPEFVAQLRKLEFKALLKKIEGTVPMFDVQQAEVELEQKQLEPVSILQIKDVELAPGQPRVIALSTDESEVWFSANTSNGAIIPVKNLDKAFVQKLLNGPIVGHDLKQLFKLLLSKGFEISCSGVHDTRIGAFLLNSLERSLDLTDLLQRSVNVDDASVVISAIWNVYDDQIVQFNELPKLSKLATEIDFPTICLLAGIEHTGVKLNSEYLNKMSVDFDVQINDIQQEVYKQAGQEFNIGSPQQLGVVLFEKLGLPTLGVKKGKTGYSTGVRELDKLRGLHPIINLITKYREYTKLKNTYIDALPKLVDSDGRLHTTFNQEVAATGRLSSVNPNLQNIPTRTELGQAIRTAFIAEPGKVFVSADYSQFELRLAAVLSGDKQMVKDFNEGVDIHAKTAAEIYNVPLGEVTKSQRRDAKVINFGVLYGMSPHGLSIATGMTIVDAKSFIDKYFEVRAPLRTYATKIIQNALNDGYVETMFGRRRPTPDLKSSNFAVREAAKRAAINMPIQGTEADLMKMAMLKVEEALGGLGNQLLQIHDSILVECPEENSDQVAKILKETMENIYKLPVKLDVDVHTGKNWGE